MSEVLGLLEADNALLFEINLVAYESLDNVGISMLIDAFKPVLHIVERSHVCHVEGHDHTVRLLVEGVSNCAESFLTCGVPDLDCYVLTFWGLESARNIVQTDGRHMTLSELLILVPIIK